MELRLGGGSFLRKMTSGGDLYRGSTRITALCRELNRMRRITIGHEKIHKNEIDISRQEGGDGESPNRKKWGAATEKGKQDDKEMRVAIRYLRNLGSYRRVGVVSPSSKDKAGISFKPKLFSDAVFFA